MLHVLVSLEFGVTALRAVAGAPSAPSLTLKSVCHLSSQTSDFDHLISASRGAWECMAGKRPEVSEIQGGKGANLGREKFKGKGMKADPCCRSRFVKMREGVT